MVKQHKKGLGSVPTSINDAVREDLRGLERELKRIGGSLTISIPRAMIRALGIFPNERVRVLLTDRGLSIVKKR